MNTNEGKTEGKHTPGPWHVHAVDESPWYVIEANNGFVAQCDDDGCLITKQDATHNARLIAAAPDLLEALGAFVEQATKVEGFPASYEPYSGALVLARAAIAKAKGE